MLGAFRGSGASSEYMLVLLYFEWNPQLGFRDNKLWQRNATSTPAMLSRQGGDGQQEEEAVQLWASSK
jgi:hypothetical protein